MRRQLLAVALPSFVLACGGCSTPKAPAPSVQGSQPSPLLMHIPAEVRTAAASPKKISHSGKTTVTFLAEGHNAFLGKLELAPNAAVPEHQDPTEEYIHVLSGHAQMTMDGTSYTIEPGTTIYMPAYAKVSVQNGNEPLVGLQVFAGPSPARKFDTWVDAGVAAPEQAQAPN
jgi:quercetin dioxygenase-like cupin family protein